MPAIEAFRDHQATNNIRFMDEITGQVLKAYKLRLYETIKKKEHGKLQNTIANRFRYLSAFLSKHGINIMISRSGGDGLMDYSDFPRESKDKVVDKYSVEEIKALLSVASIDEADMIQLFLRTGLRDEEVSRLCWTDIDFRRCQLTVQEKPEYNWRPKGRKSRMVPLDSTALARLAYRKQRTNSKLIFPSSVDKPEENLIGRLKKVAAKAEETGFKFEGRIGLHRFRRTYASMMMAHTDLQTVSALLGHQNIQTTARYLAPDQNQARIGVQSAFKGLD
jgi:integrase